MLVDWNKKPKKPKINWDKKPHEVRQNKKLKDLGGYLTPASGALDGAKGDRELDGNFKIEQKATDKKSISVKAEYLEKIYKEARQQNKEAALIFSFLSIKGYTPTDWIAIPVDVFKELYKFLKDNGYEF